MGYSIISKQGKILFIEDDGTFSFIEKPEKPPLIVDNLDILYDMLRHKIPDQWQYTEKSTGCGMRLAGGFIEVHTKDETLCYDRLSDLIGDLLAKRDASRALRNIYENLIKR